MVESKIRLLFSSNAFWSNSGYGVQGRSLLPRLAGLPEIGGVQNVAMFAWYGLQGGMHEVNGIRCYPAGVDPYGNDIIGAHAQDWGADVVISLIDVWVMKETAQKIHPALWLPWIPIDHQPVPQVVLDSLKGAHRPLTYSKWGQQLLADAGVANTYIPHGVEPSVFCVRQSTEVRRFRQEVLGNPQHLTVMVAANKGYPDRKAFQVQVRAWARFAQDKPGARLYIHTEPTTMYGGIDFGALMGNLGIADKCIFPDRYQYFRGLPAEYLALIYNNADVYLGASMSEGFGIPIIEAQASGAPVIVTDFSAMPELVRWGCKVPPRDMVWTQLNSWQAWPDVDGIWEALEGLYGQWHDNGDVWPMAKRLKAEAAIHEEYGWDVIVARNWGPLFEELAGQVRGGASSGQPEPDRLETRPAASGRRLPSPIQVVEPVWAGVNGGDHAAVV